MNGAQTNKWTYGNATGNTDRSIYISNDDGVSNTYSITTSVVGAYRNIAIPPGTTFAKLSFNWKSNGNNISVLRVYLVPVNQSITAGQLITPENGIF